LTTGPEFELGLSPGFVGSGDFGWSAHDPSHAIANDMIANCKSHDRTNS
jgi:hypothetical protein